MLAIGEALTKPLPHYLRNRETRNAGRLLLTTFSLWLTRSKDLQDGTS